MPTELEADTPVKVNDIWYCERCSRNGRVVVVPDEGAYATVERIAATHRRKSPDCLSGTMDLRILTLEED